MRRAGSGFASALLVLALALLAPASADAQPAKPDLFEEAARVWSLEVDAAESTLGRARLTSEELDELRARLVDMRNRIQNERDAAEAAEAANRRLIAVLGSPPGANDPPEADAVAGQRRQLTAEISRNDGHGRRADLAIVRVQALLDRIGLRRRELLLVELTRRDDSPLDPQEWIGAARDLPLRVELRVAFWRQWWGSTQRTEMLPAALWRALLRAVLGGAGLLGLGWFLRRRFGRAGRAIAPAYPARLLAAIADGVLFVAAPVAMVAIFAGSLVASGALPPQIAAVTHGWMAALIALVVGLVGARLVLVPDAPGWRAVPLGNGSAGRLVRNFGALAALIAIDAVAKPALFGAAQGFGNPDLRTVYEAVIVFAFGAAFAALARKGNWKPGGQITTIGEATPAAAGREAAAWRWARVGWLVAVGAALLATLAGYARLATFILANLFYSAVIIGLLTLAHAAVRELLRALARSASGERRADLFGWWVLRLADLGLGALALIAILPLWGIGWDEIGDFAWRALYGLKIGGYTVSLLNVVAAIAAFFAIRFLTRIVQRSFERTILPQTRLDPGVGNSIRAGIGYLGLLLAVLAAIGVVGLDLTNIALVAGALSVGIGFGLQNIVNNFVSGIILLIERPIKVGDWVVVGGHEGTVRRISVRATEIETFRRSSVIIPNAEFLSSAVVNWTYADNFGRVDIRVGVAYGTDIEKVERILLELANAEPRLMPTPAPLVLVLAFGDSQIEVELRGVVRDAATMGFVASDLRKKILVRFAQEGIEIPYPQRVVNVRGGALPPDEAAAAGG